MNVRRVIVAAATAGLVASAVALAPAAQAYDKDGYTYAAGHMIERSDVPKALGSFKTDLSFGATAGGDNIYVCTVPDFDPNTDDVSVTIPAAKYAYSGGYDGRGKQAPSISANVNQYGSASAAIKAFNLLKKRIKICTGTDASSYTDEDGNTTVFSTQLTNGVVPSVTTLGVQSLFVNQNNLSDSLPAGEGSLYVSDSYTVYSLFNDTIIITSYYSNSTVNLTTAQRKAVNQVAFNAETRWAS